MYKVNEVWWSPEPPDGFFSLRLEPTVDIQYQQRYRYWVYRTFHGVGHDRRGRI